MRVDKQKYSSRITDTKIKIAVGCGWRNYGKEWIHIDGGHYDHLDSTDIFLKEFKENSVDIIYASHVIEYFSLEELKVLLSQWLRVLTPLGILRIAVPDLGRIFSLYREQRFNLESFLGPMYGKMKMGNLDIYHKLGFDFNFLSQVLNAVGFCDIYRYNWRMTEHASIDDHSQSYLPKMDKINGSLISLNIEAKKIPFTEINHGMRNTKTYRCWNGMLSRCSNTEGNRDIEHYTKRGIKVEDYRWLTFINFLNDMGECPIWGSLDRIDNNKGYYKANCKWSDTKQQNLNRSSNRLIEYNGEIKPLTKWANEFGTSCNVIRGRLNTGWSIEEALTIPIAKKRKK